MAAETLQNMDVEALLALRADVEKALTERSRDLQRQCPGSVVQVR